MKVVEVVEFREFEEFGEDVDDVEDVVELSNLLGRVSAKSEAKAEAHRSTRLRKILQI